MVAVLPPTPSKPLRECAAEYIERGWSLIPIEPGGKRPPVLERVHDRERRYGWERHQTERATLRDVDGWLRRWPQMNLGIVTGVISGLAVLDLDGPEGRAALKATGVQPPVTLTAATPKGWHAYYAVREPCIRNAVGLVSRVDVRGEGGYVVAPPSLRPEGAYHWLNAVALEDAPAWLGDARLVRPAPSPSRAPLNGTTRERWAADVLTNGAPEGQRNQTATRLAGYLHSKGLPDDVIEALLLPWAARCTPALDELELRQVIGHVARYAVAPHDGGVLVL